MVFSNTYYTVLIKLQKRYFRISTNLHSYGSNISWRGGTFFGVLWFAPTLKRSEKLTNSAHDTGVVSEDEREITPRNWLCNFRPATAQIKPSERHIGRPKPAICEASVSAATMTDISELSDRRTRSQPIVGSTWRLLERVCVRCCVQNRAHNLLTCSVSTHLLANRLRI